MIKVSVLYPNSAGIRFDFEYYLHKHMPLVRSLLGDALRGCAVDLGLGGVAPGGKQPFVAVGHLYFESLEAFRAAFGAHLKAITADVANYTDVQPLTQIAEVGSELRRGADGAWSPAA